MKVIKGNAKDVELMSLGENLWHCQSNMLKETDLTLREVMSSLIEEEKEKLIDRYTFDRPSSFTTRLNERYSFYRRQNSPLFDHELRSTEDIDKINQSSRFGLRDYASFINELVYYRPREGLKLDEKYLRQKVVNFEGYLVPITLAPVLETLLHKNLASDLFGSGLSSLTHPMKSVIATLLCVVIDRMWKTKIEDVTKDDFQDWFFCLNAIKEITNSKTFQLYNFLETEIFNSFFGFEAIRY